MPTNYLSRLPSLPVSAIEQPQILAFDPFKPDLQLLQRQDNELQAIFYFLKMALGMIPSQSKPLGHWLPLPL